MSCTVCEGFGKYKCPKCYAKYCSVACCKLHKEKSCSLVKEEETSKPPSDDLISRAGLWQGPEETEDFVPTEKLAKLGDSKEVKDLLHNPHLRIMLEDLVKSQDPAADMEAAMYEPIFVELADACLKVVEADSSPDV